MPYPTPDRPFPDAPSAKGRQKLSPATPPPPPRPPARHVAFETARFTIWVPVGPCSIVLLAIAPAGAMTDQSPFPAGNAHHWQPNDDATCLLHEDKTSLSRGNIFSHHWNLFDILMEFLISWSQILVSGCVAHQEGGPQARSPPQWQRPYAQSAGGSLGRPPARWR